MAILYITQQGAVLHKSGNRIIVKKDQDVLQEIPIVKVDEVVIFGNGHLTTQTMGFLLHKNIPVSFLSSQGKYKGKLQPPFAKDTLLRQYQYAVAVDTPQCLELAKCFVQGKLTNAIRFSQRQRTQNAEVKAATSTIRQTLEKLKRAKNLDSLLGYEGSATVAHYRAFRQFLTRDWGFTTRQFRPPPDPIKPCSHLAIHFYTTTFTHSSTSWVDPYCGYSINKARGTLHSIRSDGRFRQIVVDGYVRLLSINNRIKQEDFEKTEKGIALQRKRWTVFLSGDLSECRDVSTPNKK